jgi:hypothetical protein
MYSYLQETTGCYRILDEHHCTIARVVGLNPTAPAFTKHTAGLVIEFLNHPISGAKGFDCRAIKQESLFPILPTDDESMEEFVAIIGPDDQPMAHVSDYGQGVKLVDLLNRAIH